MWFSSLMRNPKRSGLGHGRRMPAASRQRSTFRPQLEALEGRDVPSTLTVTSNLGFGPGSLRTEIYSAQNGDTIVFDNSLKSKTIVTNDFLGGTPSEIEINKSINIQGLGANHLAISGGYFSRVFRVDGIDLLIQPVHVTISGLTIENGWGRQAGLDPATDDGEGGGIINYGTLTLTGCTLSGNSVTIFPGLGGAIYNAGTLTLSGCTVTGNSALQGGGIFNASTLTLTGSTVTRNSAVYGYSAVIGGGIYNAGTLTLSGSTVSQNSGTGAGIYNDYSGVLTILSSTVKNNHGTFDLYNLGTWSADSNSTIGTVGP